MEIESGAKRIKTIILTEALEELRVQRWIRNFLIHPLLTQQEKPSLTSLITKEESEDD